MEIVEMESDRLFEGFYNKKRVLLTGHTGFKGSWLSIWLKELGAEVTGYALDPYTYLDNFVLSGLTTVITDIRGDICDKNKLKAVFDEIKPEIVFHLAAQPHVRESYENPSRTYEINVLGTLNVLECIRDSDTAKVGIMVTSDKCYENRGQIWGYRETDPIGGYDPYSSSKGCAELLINSFRSSYLNPLDFKKHGKCIASVRAGDVIGGGDWREGRLIPNCMRALTSEGTIEIRDPDSVRPWQHVLEPLRGYLMLAARMWTDGAAFSSAWNFGPEQDGMVRVGDIVDKVLKGWKSGSWKTVAGSDTYNEAALLRLDCTKAGTYLGWRPALKLDEAVNYTVEWYKNCLIKDVYGICANQIERYTGVCLEQA